MTQHEVVDHWRRGAKDALDAAVLLIDPSKYPLALFHCHLALEKILKSAFIAEHDREPPFTHNLWVMAKQLTRSWPQEEAMELADLSKYAVAARYDDRLWMTEEATKEKTVFVLNRTHYYFSLFV